MTLTTLNDNQPEWVKPELGLEEYKEFKLGQKVKFAKDWVYIIHIQKNTSGEILLRGMLSNGASITMVYELIDKPVTTTNEQPIIIDENLTDYFYKLSKECKNSKEFYNYIYNFLYPKLRLIV